MSTRYTCQLPGFSSVAKLAVLSMIFYLLLYYYFIAELNIVVNATKRNDFYNFKPHIDKPLLDKEISRELVGSNKCSDLPIPKLFWNMTIDNSSAFVTIPHTHDINIDETLCVRVVVPSKPVEFYSTFAPIANTPWDSILLDMVGQRTGISIPVSLQMTDNTANYKNGLTHIYEADVLFRDADVYYPQGYIEYRNAKWNSEQHLNAQPLLPEPLEISDKLIISVTAKQNNTNPYGLDNYLNLPFCTTANAEGRWIHIDQLPFDISLASPPDNFNRVWLPYKCRLRQYSYPQLFQCLKEKYPLIHWFGDSNTRRALKKITSLGNWCSAPEERNNLMCTCNDNASNFGKYDTHALFAPIDFDSINGGNTALQDYSNGNLGLIPANKTRIVLFRWGGLTMLNNPPWSDTFNGGINVRAGVPSIAIFALVNWDVAFSSYTFFTQEVNKLLDLVSENYPASTQIVIRTGQYFCCTYDMDINLNRKYSRLRYKYFNDYIVNAFQIRFGSSRKVHVWDVSQISERREYHARQEASTCAPNHVRAEIIDLENQILANAICN
ncbi:hypothetical protein COEREDRAFT_87751 [Coemansia reversa NRRL 1564]|uniref:Uncharacterized protein n=1 Tax=Coemansia reversa (strain ATCC 12441 / NRRL 1564) TaxID=763665 RepID=A0A2G5B970_COERN|nr:hypothetical protein COEREDRAFT_87751 [Coemansia reversa NRRL 1564]|eukprot:PIA15565.1 hypothetical protein COEREDRAFT_87751 [Coemansia reversa NRRL 1564]